MPASEMAAIGGTALLILASLWMTMRHRRDGPPHRRPLDPQRRTLVNLGIVLTLGLVGLIGRLVFVSVIRANAVRTRSGADEKGDVLSNPRIIGATLSPGRGRILDRKG